MIDLTYIRIPKGKNLLGKLSFNLLSMGHGYDTLM